MSLQTFPYQAPEGSGSSGGARVPASVLGAVAGVGLFLLLPGQTKADGGSYGHAEVTIGFPHGQVTVGKTWDDHPGRVVVEETAPRYPEAEDIDDEDEDCDRNDGVSDHVIIEHRHHRHHVRRVTVIERHEEPAYCDRDADVVRRVYVDPPAYRRPEVVVYRRAPERVIYAPSRTVIVTPGERHGYEGGDRGGHGEYHGNGGYQNQGGNQGPRNLFPPDQGRPMRSRGVQQHFAQR